MTRSRALAACVIATVVMSAACGEDAEPEESTDEIQAFYETLREDAAEFPVTDG